MGGRGRVKRGRGWCTCDERPKNGRSGGRKGRINRIQLTCINYHNTDSVWFFWFLAVGVSNLVRSFLVGSRSFFFWSRRRRMRWTKEGADNKKRNTNKTTRHQRGHDTPTRTRPHGHGTTLATPGGDGRNDRGDATHTRTADI